MLEQIQYETLAGFLSPERLATYLREAKDDKQKAVDLYIENLNQSRMLYSKLHWLEIGPAQCHQSRAIAEIRQ